MSITFTVGQIQAVTGDLKGNLVRIEECLTLTSNLTILPSFGLTGGNLKGLENSPDFQNAVNTFLEKLKLRINHPLLMGGFFNGNLAIKYLIPGQIFTFLDEAVLELEGYKLGVGLNKFVVGDLSIKLSANAFRKGENTIQPTCKSALEVNLVGGADELVFYGGSKALQNGKIWKQFEYFSPQIEKLEWKNGEWQGKPWAPKYLFRNLLYAAMVKGLKDYVEQNHFLGVVLGVSGGIDSALTLAIAVDALGSNKIRAFYLPSRYSSPLSHDLAKALCENFKVNFNLWSIEELHENYIHAFKTQNGEPWYSKLVDENIQARIRANLLMGVANNDHYLLLSTGNKSELAMGYNTLYGDMAGGFNVIGDLFKTEIYDLAQLHKDKIPEEIFLRPPSGELSFNQKDQDILPPYEILDKILTGLMDGFSTEILKEQFGTVVDWVFERWLKMAFKREQTCLSLSFTPPLKAFPLTHPFKCKDWI